MGRIELKGQAGALYLTDQENQWCQVGLLLDGKNTILGSDDGGILRKRLGTALKPSLDGEWVEREKMKVYFVLTLFEQHGSIYTADCDDGRILSFENAQGESLGSFALTREDCLRWEALLFPE